MQSIFVAFIVIFGVISVQPDHQLSAKAVTSEVTDGSRVQDKLRNLFDSITMNDVEKTRTYRNVLGEEAAREQQVFDTMKGELRSARQRNTPESGNFNDKNGGAAFKRETHENKNGPNNIYSQGDASQQCKVDSSTRSKRNSQNTTQAKYTVVMVRHGESLWNLKNLFCGWFDAQLSDKGVEEAKNAGRNLRDLGYTFDVAYTSVLARARDTLYIILEQMRLDNIPFHETWRLNERFYGALTGMNKAETAQKYGEEQVRIWRRSFDVPPPPMEKDHLYYGMIVNDPRYFHGPERSQFPLFESLKMTIERTLPYWNDVIVPQIKSGKKVLIVAHGNSLRGIVKYLDNRSEEDIMTLNLPTGIPFLYELDENLKPVTSLKFLGDEETVAKAVAAVEAQGKAG